MKTIRVDLRTYKRTIHDVLHVHFRYLLSRGNRWLAVDHGQTGKELLDLPTLFIKRRNEMNAHSNNASKDDESVGQCPDASNSIR